MPVIPDQIKKCFLHRAFAPRRPGHDQPDGSSAVGEGTEGKMLDETSLLHVAGQKGDSLTRLYQ